MAPPKHDVSAAPAAPYGLRAACERLGLTLVQLARSQATDEGISLPQLLLLGAIHRAGPVPVSQLAAWTGAPISTISGVVDGLVDAKLLRREHGVEDRRQVLVSLSAEGRRVADRVEAQRVERWAPLAARIRGSRADVTIRVLEEIASELDPATLVVDASAPDGLSLGRSSAAAFRESRRMAT